MEHVLQNVGPRLRELRQQKDITLADLSASTGISVSTLSRLESGQRRPTLELLLPLARVHQVPLDELGEIAAMKAIANLEKELAAFPVSERVEKAKALVERIALLREAKNCA